LQSYLIPEDNKLQENLTKNKKLQKVSSKDKIKDEFEHMVNWKRVFENLWHQIRWLSSYGSINELALRKIMKKFVKNFFEIKDNTLTRKLGQMIDNSKFKQIDG
jgi:signal transduction protein with GAF and PtsI domain